MRMILATAAILLLAGQSAASAGEGQGQAGSRSAVPREPFDSPFCAGRLVPRRQALLPGFRHAMVTFSGEVGREPDDRLTILRRRWRRDELVRDVTRVRSDELPHGWLDRLE